MPSPPPPSPVKYQNMGMGRRQSHLFSFVRYLSGEYFTFLGHTLSVTHLASRTVAVWAANVPLTDSWLKTFLYIDRGAYIVIVIPNVYRYLYAIYRNGQFPAGGPPTATAHQHPPPAISDAIVDTGINVIPSHSSNRLL